MPKEEFSRDPSNDLEVEINENIKSRIVKISAKSRPDINPAKDAKKYVYLCIDNTDPQYPKSTVKNPFSTSLTDNEVKSPDIAVFRMAVKQFERFRKKNLRGERWIVIKPVEDEYITLAKKLIAPQFNLPFSLAKNKDFVKYDLYPIDKNKLRKPKRAPGLYLCWDQKNQIGYFKNRQVPFLDDEIDDKNIFVYHVKEEQFKHLDRMFSEKAIVINSDTAAKYAQIAQEQLSQFVQSEKKLGFDKSESIQDLVKTLEEKMKQMTKRFEEKEKLTAKDAEIFDNYIVAPNNDAAWQLLTQLTINQVNVNPVKGLTDVLANPGNGWNIGTSIGFPIAIALVASVIRYIYKYHDFESKLNSNPEYSIGNKNALITDIQNLNVSENRKAELLSDIQKLGGETSSKDALINKIDQLNLPTSTKTSLLTNIDRVETRVNLLNAKKSDLIKDAASYAAKAAVSMLTWEAGLFVGQCVLTLLTSAFAFDPNYLLATVVLSLVSGLIQGIYAVCARAAEKAFENRHLGWKVMAKVFFSELATLESLKLFSITFISGFASQLAMLIPILGFAAQVSKPLFNYFIIPVLSAVSVMASNFFFNIAVPFTKNKIIALYHHLKEESGPKNKDMPHPRFFHEAGKDMGSTKDAKLDIGKKPTK